MAINNWTVDWARKVDEDLRKKTAEAPPGKCFCTRCEFELLDGKQSANGMRELPDGQLVSPYCLACKKHKEMESDYRNSLARSRSIEFSPINISLSDLDPAQEAPSSTLYGIGLGGAGVGGDAQAGDRRTGFVARNPDDFILVEPQVQSDWTIDSEALSRTIQSSAELVLRHQEAISHSSMSAVLGDFDQGNAMRSERKKKKKKPRPRSEDIDF